MTTNLTLSILQDDIRTMQKDIKRAKGIGMVKKEPLPKFLPTPSKITITPIEKLPQTETTTKITESLSVENSEPPKPKAVFTSIASNKPPVSQPSLNNSDKLVEPTPRRATPNTPFMEKPFLKDIPAVAKEKLETGAKTENEQKKKFMEDIESWANSYNRAGREE